MAEADTQVVDVPVVEQVAVEPEPVVVPQPDADEAEVDLTKEPGGDKPEDVYARRRARELRQAKQELENERQQRIRLEERARILEEQAKSAPKPAETKIFSIAEVNAAVEAGNLNRADADRYIDEVILPARINDTIGKREKQLAEKQPVESAGKYVDDYIKTMPSLADKTSEDFVRVAQKYNELVQMGLPGDFRTQKVALDLVHGDIDTRRKRAELSNLNAKAPRSPVDGGSGGAGGGNTTSVNLSGAPDFMQRIWERTGTSHADRETEFKLYQSTEKQRQSRGNR